jgi:hypothetical protein
LSPWPSLQLLSRPLWLLSLWLSPPLLLQQKLQLSRPARPASRPSAVPRLHLLLPDLSRFEPRPLFGAAFFVSFG